MATAKDLENYKKNIKANRIDDVIQSAATYYGIDKDLLRAQVFQESKGDTNATGYKLENPVRADGKRYYELDPHGKKIPTAFGLMQLNPPSQS